MTLTGIPIIDQPDDLGPRRVDLTRASPRVLDEYERAMARYLPALDAWEARGALLVVGEVYVDAVGGRWEVLALRPDGADVLHLPAPRMRPEWVDGAQIVRTSRRYAALLLGGRRG